MYSGTRTGADGLRYSVRMLLTQAEYDGLSRAGVLDCLDDVGEVLWMQHVSDEWCAQLDRDANQTTLH